MKKIYLLFIVLSFSSINSQVKIGDNPPLINQFSLLELESDNKALVITRITTTQMNAITPLKGALIYNTDDNCIFMYTNTGWQSLCNSNGSGIKVTTSNIAPTNNTEGDFWINDTTNNTTSIWNGLQWLTINNNPRKGIGAPSNTNATNPIAGDVYVDSSTGNIYAYNGTSWAAAGNTIIANNGLTINNNTIELGGTLTKPTILTTDANNTISIEGLQTGDVTTDDIVTVTTNGVLKKVSVEKIIKQEDILLPIAVDDQLVFNSGFTLKTTDKINVYRNGVRIKFTLNSPTQITLEPEAKCYAGDQIRIVQFY